MLYKGYFLYYLGGYLKQYNFRDYSEEQVLLIRRLTQLKSTRFMGGIIVECDKENHTEKIVEI